MFQLLKPKAKLILTPKDIKGETIDEEKYYEYLNIINESIASSTTKWIVLPERVFPLNKLLVRLQKECKRSGWNLYQSGHKYELCPLGKPAQLLCILTLLGILITVGLIVAILIGDVLAARICLGILIVGALGWHSCKA